MENESSSKLEALIDLNNQLIVQAIAASDRTTRAVRAFVRFLFIQLVAITLALVINGVGNALQDPSECSFGVCPTNQTAQILAVLVWLAGVWWSSLVGWEELGKSDVPDIRKLERLRGGD